MTSRAQHIGYGITFFLIIVTTSIRAATINVDAINSGNLRDGESNGGFSNVTTGGPLSAEVDISGNMDMAIDTTIALGANEDADINMQNQDLCYTRNNPVQTDSLHEHAALDDSIAEDTVLEDSTAEDTVLEDSTAEDTVLAAICDSLKREKFDDHYLKEMQIASSLQATITREMMVNHVENSLNNTGSRANPEYRNISKLGFGSSSGIEGSSTSNLVVTMAIVLLPAIVLFLAIGSYEITFNRAVITAIILLPLIIVIFAIGS